MNLIEKLYNGELYPLEEIVPQGERYREVNEKIGEMRDYFSEKLSAGDREKFNHWNDLIQESKCMEGYANFEYGFRLGILLIVDVGHVKNR